MSKSFKSVIAEATIGAERLVPLSNKHEDVSELNECGPISDLTG